MIDDYRCLVLCGRELRIYNFDEGLFVMKLREVMNQKMPYFGLHDKDHVVALSRSRMYVNMMNLQNGDCVATFKVCVSMSGRGGVGGRWGFWGGGLRKRWARMV